MPPNEEKIFQAKFHANRDKKLHTTDVMSNHVTAVRRTGYLWLRQLRSVVQSLKSEAADSMVHAFISCRLDYCNALLSGIAISPERSCASGDWNPAHRPHYAGSPVTSLAGGATTRHSGAVLRWGRGGHSPPPNVGQPPSYNILVPTAKIRILKT